jgi:hypothetical protein
MMVKRSNSAAVRIILLLMKPLAIVLMSFFSSMHILLIGSPVQVSGSLVLKYWRALTLGCAHRTNIGGHMKTSSVGTSIQSTRNTCSYRLPIVNMAKVEDVALQSMKAVA